ncbi:MAG: aminotransferase DegT [Flavobacteriaceae bacterium]|nr:aminotransferase DegT [Flavobacteriaceae bacterium]|tara:strand:+ start:1178 stop:2272 length:1095 start_codon:yes stop_codon:yes gene_type:complete
MNIDFANLPKAYQVYKSEFDEKIQKVIDTSNFIMGEPVIELEEKLKNYTGAKHAITCSSGTDALLLALMAIDIQPGDEVITTPFTFIATAETIAFLKAKPVFVDIDEDTYNIDVTEIESKITSRTKAIIPVSLYGQPSEMDAINLIAKKNGLNVIEDAAQSFGATYKGRKSCNLSEFSCTSFFPAKPLGCFGDGGAIFTNNYAAAEKIKSLRLHGQTKRYHHKYIGMGGRLDTLQAAILNVKMRYYENDLLKRQKVAQLYEDALGDLVNTPKVEKDKTSAWAQYTIRLKNRNDLRNELKLLGIPTSIHYPVPLHLQECFAYLNYKKGDFPISERTSDEVLSLPMNPYLTLREIEYITNHIKRKL